ncbi:hypothetical protein NL393_32710, partial [Klebsiella pneumoniae]|nr:hypothetical protein [Klebsiella pneumoniae]
IIIYILLMMLFDFNNLIFLGGDFIYDLLSFNFIFYSFVIGIIGGLVVLMSGRGQKIFDNAHKIITGTAGGTVIYNNFGKGSGSDDKNKDVN